MAMVQAADIDRVLYDAASARLPAGRVLRVSGEPYLNSVNEEGLRVTIVLADHTQENLDGDTILDTILQVSARIHTAGDDRVPMLIFTTEEEQAADGDEDE